jgi:Trypsin-co-occurring domain 1
MVVVAVDGDGESVPIQIEVAEAPRPDVAEVYAGDDTRGVSDQVTKLARPLFSDALGLVRSCATQVRRQMDEMPADNRPDEFEMQFAVKLDATFGAAIVNATGGAQLQVTLRWKS